MTDEELKRQRPKYWRDKNRRKWAKGSGPIGIEAMSYLLANPQEMLWDDDTKKPVSVAFIANCQALFLYRQLMRGRYYFACPIKPTIEANNEEVKG